MYFKGTGKRRRGGYNNHRRDLMSKGEKMMLKIGLKIVSLCVLVLLAACGSEASRQNSNEEISAPTHAPTIAGVLAATGTTWQEAYAALLREYASQCPYAADYPWMLERGYGWHFALHDINNSGIPELFLMEKSRYLTVTYYAVYTFIDGELTPLEFQSTTSWGFIFAPLDGRAFVIDVDKEGGRAASYRRWDIDGLTLVATARGLATLNEAGREKLDNRAEDAAWIDWTELYQLDDWYEWFFPYITTDGWSNRQLLTAREFENIFPRRDERRRLEILPITDENINNLGNLHAYGTAARINTEPSQEITWTAHSNSGAFTTAILFEFSEPVSSLSADQISFSDGTGWIYHQLGALSGGGTSWSLEVTALRAGWVLVWIDNPEVELVTEVTIHRPLLTWTAATVGTQTTDSINFTFEAPASLEIMDIEIIDDTGAIASLSSEDLSGVLGTSWTLDVTVLRAGNIQVSLFGPGTVGFERGPKEVAVWK